MSNLVFGMAKSTPFCRERLIVLGKGTHLFGHGRSLGVGSLTKLMPHGEVETSSGWDLKEKVNRRRCVRANMRVHFRKT